LSDVRNFHGFSPAVSRVVGRRVFFHSLKAELTRGVTFTNERARRTAVTAYMRYYNTIRLHSGLCYLSPLAFERRTA
jgi:putative transposase